jgi:hypothetical protein
MLKWIAIHPPYFWSAKRPQIGDELRWIVDRCNGLEESRNDAIHSPLSGFGGNRLIAELVGMNPDDTVWPNSWQFNPRAISLAKSTNILKEFSYCRDCAMILASYTGLINQALCNEGIPWPERPSLPTRTTKKIQSQK